LGKLPAAVKKLPSTFYFPCEMNSDSPSPLHPIGTLILTSNVKRIIIAAARMPDWLRSLDHTDISYFIVTGENIVEQILTLM
jgi:hypothetical protein